MECVKMILTLTLLVLLKESKGTPRWTNRDLYPSWNWQHVKRSETVQGIRDDSYRGQNTFSPCLKNLAMELYHSGDPQRFLLVDQEGILNKESETTGKPITVVVSGIDHSTPVTITGLGPFSTSQLTKQVVMIPGSGKCAKATITSHELLLLGFNITKQIQVTVPTPYGQIDMAQAVM
ncbi:uncharacterized protein LOC134693792 [Mytilus trossulus]|uniref:uncharacterized protein LOC134693792 n=1 Tax=Mytilus trossulus TaxID=6551 RepID=UPI003007AD58